MIILSSRRVQIAVLLWCISFNVYAADLFLQRPEVSAYLDEISRDKGIDRSRLAGLFSRVSTQQDILDAISTPAEGTLTWQQYRPIFLKNKRIELGREFIDSHRDLLNRATKTYGVPANIITAIIGVETYYGRIVGKHGVLESLATLAFDYPPRSRFFKQELTEFLVLGEAEGWDMLARKGSYAGTMGVPQFISSSYRQYAVDFDGDGKRDLFNSMADVIGSVANYLSVHGWVEDAPIAQSWPQVGTVPTAVSDLVRTSLRPTVSGVTVARLGFDAESLAAGTQGNRLLSVMTLDGQDGQDGQEVWVGYRNFYAITRYNHSRLYAMAVFQLAEAIGQADNSTLE